MSRLEALHRELIKDTLQFIYRHRHEKLTIARLAERSGFSRWHLQRLFKHATGMAMGRYIQQMRLECAAKELIDTEKRVLDVALDYGYDSQHSLTRAMTVHFGMSPGALKKLPQNEQLSLLARCAVTRDIEHAFTV